MKNLLLNEIKKSIIGWKKDGIYAISLFVYDNNDNPCEPTVTLGYNTEKQFKRKKRHAYNEREACWNYAYWLQNREFLFGYDKNSANTIKAWLTENNFPYYPADEVDYQKIKNEGLDKITKSFISILVDVVQTLHSSGFIKEQFGREIPIIIHELEYYDEIAKQNIEANTLELVEDFVAFCYEG